MAPSKGEHGTCPTKTVGGVIVNVDIEDENEDVSQPGEEVSHKGETKAQRRERFAEERRAKANGDDD